MCKIAVALLVAILCFSQPAPARDCPKGEAGAPAGYEHNKFGVVPSDQVRKFSAFIVSFDGADDDDDDDGDGDTRRVAEWVAYELQANQEPGPGSRQSPWCHDEELERAGLAARDRAYEYTREFRDQHPDWYVRGHLAPKSHAQRISEEAAKDTHTTLNAVPQRQSFNNGSWRMLECLTGAWANKHDKVWVVTGPIFESGSPSSWIGERDKGEQLVAVPDQLFKVVIRNDDSVKVLAFILDNVTESRDSRSGPESTLRRVAVTEVEAATGLVFTKLPDDLKAGAASKLWPVEEADFVNRGCKKMKIE